MFPSLGNKNGEFRVGFASGRLLLKGRSETLRPVSVAVESS